MHIRQGNVRQKKKHTKTTHRLCVQRVQSGEIILRVDRRVTYKVTGVYRLTVTCRLNL